MQSLPLSLAVLSLPLLACAGILGETGWDVHDEEDGACSDCDVLAACYDLDTDDGPTCCGHDDRTTFQSDGYAFVDCVWYCAEWKGRDRYVDLSFIREPGEGWAFDGAFTSGCI